MTATEANAAGATPGYAASADVERPTRSFYKRNESFILGATAVAIFFAVWESCWQAGMIDPLFFSGPSAIFTRLYDGLAGGDILRHVLFSAQNFGYGFLIAAVTGIPLGILLGWYDRPRMIVEPFIAALYSTPRIAFIPLIVMWFGIGLGAKVFIVFLSAFFPILLNAMAGVRTTDANLLKAARSFNATEKDIFMTVILPSTVPFLIVGLRQGLAHGLIGMVVGEFFAGSSGIGYLLGSAGMTFESDLLFACVVLVAFAGITITVVLQQVEKRFQRWRPAA